MPAAAGSARQYDEKNIRRRVYDALNVLMAMDIITRQKKDIVWRGLPHNQVSLPSRHHGGTILRTCLAQ